jgi:hypothetical protein
MPTIGEAWFHGSPHELTELRPGSTITQDRALARVFSHKPTIVSDARAEGGELKHNGILPGRLYLIDERIKESDIIPVPGSTIGPGQEWHVARPLKIRLLEAIVPIPEELLTADEENALHRN